jgi:uncharacterized membrane protein YphA (DoxX/SURF4 family)
MTTRNQMLVNLARMILGIIFLFASIEKTADPAAFTQSIMNYRLVPLESAVVAATFLPWIELVCGAALLAGIWVRGSTLLCLIMLVVFTAAVISGIVRGLDITCGCFTQDTDVGKLGWTKIAENAALIAASLLLFIKSVQPQEQSSTS